MSSRKFLNFSDVMVVGMYLLKMGILYHMEKPVGGLFLLLPTSCCLSENYAGWTLVYGSFIIQILEQDS